MGQEPDTIREDIEETRIRMSEKADALAYKSDVPARSKDKLHEVTDRVKEKVSGVLPSGGTKSAASDKAYDARYAASGTAHDAKDAAGAKARQAKGIVQDNPLGLVVGAIAAGFLAGLAVPSTRIEDEKLGPVADDLKSRASDLGHEALDRGKEVASAATDAAKDAASDSAAEQKDGFAESASSQAQDVKSSSTL